MRGRGEDEERSEFLTCQQGGVEERWMLSVGLHSSLSFSLSIFFPPHTHTLCVPFAHPPRLFVRPASCRVHPSVTAAMRAIKSAWQPGCSGP